MRISDLGQKIVVHRLVVAHEKLVAGLPGAMPLAATLEDAAPRRHQCVEPLARAGIEQRCACVLKPRGIAATEA